MSERNSMNEMFGELKNFQVEAPLEVMEMAIAKANQKRRLRLLARWSAVMVLLIGAVTALTWNSQVVDVVVPQNTSGSSKVVAPQVDQFQEVSIEKNDEKKASVRKANETAIESTSTSTTNKTSECYGVENPALPSENSASSNQKSQLEIDSVAVAPESKPNAVNQQEVQKLKSKGQRKLKLIIPQP